MLPFALAIFTGAFLLFLGQPLVGKYILPWYGGGPGVWTTCLLFFQGVLLAGYCYAHLLSTFFTPRRQVVVHGALLALSLATLQIAPGERLRPRPGDDPVWSILLLLTATIGLPFLTLSATGPLLQRWFSLVRPNVSPYRLYALSNAGSLLALISFPVFVEPHLPRAVQATAWAIGLASFAVACSVCAWLVWRDSLATGDAAPQQSAALEVAGGPEDRGDAVLWVALPAIASILLVATTTRLCQDVAAMPLLWVLPLGVYLVSFIVCFDHAHWYRRGVFTALSCAGVVVTWQLFAAGNYAPLRIQVVSQLMVLLAACMVCHGELYRLRPEPRQLTAYFLAIATGGALGGLAVAVVAPAVFTDDYELQIGLWLLVYALGVLSFRHRSRTIPLAAAVGTLLGVMLLPWLRSRFSNGANWWTEAAAFLPGAAPWVAAFAVLFAVCLCDPWRRSLSPPWRPAAGGFLMVLCGAIGAAFLVLDRDSGERPVLRTRNFYGTLKVFEASPLDDREPHRLLVHGATTHGLQFITPEFAWMPTTYYAPSSGVGRAIESLPAAPRRLGLVGLGVGTLAAYGRKGDSLRIYEINPAIRDIAQEQFTFLGACPAQIEVVMGDARLMLEHELAAGTPQRFDLLALDAFSSDAIPVHLLTREAFETYLDHLAPDGILAVHVSNRYLNLAPVVERLADHFSLAVAAVNDPGGDQWWVYGTTWMLLGRDAAFLERPAIAPMADLPIGPPRCELWTDDFASVWSIMIP